MSARSEAKALNLKRYVSERRCPKGHFSERFVSSGRCVQCSYDQRNQYWAEDREGMLKKARDRRSRNPERYREQRRSRYAKDIEASRAIGREESAKYRLSNPESLKANKARHYVSRGAHIRERNRLNYAANREERREKGAAWAKANPEKTRASCHAYRARKRNAEGRFTPDDIKKIFALQKGKCAYCRFDLKKGSKHIDHIVALINGGSNKPSNLQLLCRSCNCSKQDRDAIEFANSRGMLL